MRIQTKYILQLKRNQQWISYQTLKHDFHYVLDLMMYSDDTSISKYSRRIIMEIRLKVWKFAILIFRSNVCSIKY